MRKQIKKISAVLSLFLGTSLAQDLNPLVEVANSIVLPGASDLYEDLELPSKAKNGKVNVTWESNDTLFLSHTGKINGRLIGESKLVKLKLQLEEKGNLFSQTYYVYVHGYEPYSNYLFVYFPSNNDENIYYAISNDGYNYTAMNGGKRVVAADTVSIKKGLRDPHILRAPDGYFYMVNTDMKSAEGWASNRGIVLMKSKDLIHWTHSTVHFPERYKNTNFANVTRVWAPETIWDKNYQNTDGTNGRLLVYFSLLTNDNTISYDKVYYAYANDDFTDLLGEPTFFYDRGSATIDMDIVFNPLDQKYHGFFKDEQNGGIFKTTAHNLTAKNGKEGSQWSKPGDPLQQTTERVEGAGVFKLINQNSWILMYDCYMDGHYQFTSSSDLENFKFVQDTKTSGAFTPRHGTVIPITAEETAALMKAFPTNGFSPVVIDIPDSIGVSDGKKVVAPCSGTKIIPYVKINDGGWNETTELKVAKGATVQFGPHPWDGKDWEWTGPDGFTSTSRENTLANVEAKNSGTYTVTYTNEARCKSVSNIKLIVEDPDSTVTDTTISAIRDFRNKKESHDVKNAAKNSVYFDLLGNRLNSKPRNTIYLKK